MNNPEPYGTVLSHLPFVNPLNAKLNPFCHLLALLGAHHFLHVSRIRVNLWYLITFDVYTKYMKSGVSAQWIRLCSFM